MNPQTAVLFLPDQTTVCPENQTPLILRPVFFCPLLTWLCSSLQERGVRRVLLVADASMSERLLSAVPNGIEAIPIDGARHAELLLSALAEERERVLVLTGPLLPVGVFSGGCAYTTPVSALCDVLRTHRAFAAIPEDCKPENGYLPVGDEEELNAALPMCRQKLLEKHRKNGVSFLDSNAVYIDPRVRIGAGTEVLPGTILRGDTVIGENCVIGPNAMLRDCTVGNGTTVNASQANESRIGAEATVGPFAYIRPNSVIGDKVKVGDFVEIKNSVIGSGTKISHLTYVGDSDVGERVNFGCGTVTTNYDGFRKYRCTIGDDAFIGCNTNLIAPVTVGKASYIAAGSTIDSEVPQDSLAIARSRQTVLPDWAKNRRETEELRKKKP